MWLFGYSTYQKYFPRAAPFLAFFAFLQAFILNVLHLENFFIWHLALSILVFVWWGVKSKRQATGLLSSLSDNADLNRIAAESIHNTWLFFFLSVILFLVVFTISFVWMYNS